MKFRLFIFLMMLTLSACFSCCNNNVREETTEVDTTISQEIKSNQEKAYKILEKLIVAEKRFAVKNGYYAEIVELKEKDFFQIDDTEITESGYRIRIEHNGVREFKIFMNPIKYKETGIISYYANETSKIRGGDHGGGDASPADPEIEG